MEIMNFYFHPNKPLLLLLLLLFSFFLIAFSHLSQKTQQNINIPGVKDEDGEFSVFSLEGGEGYLRNSSNVMVLAKEQTHRRDPFDHFRYYNGGWNISNLHYISSVTFTAVPLQLISAVWLVGFGMCLLCICIYHCCCYAPHYHGYSPASYACLLSSLALFTIAAIMGCIVLYAGQGKFHDSTINTLEYMEMEAIIVGHNLKNISNYLSQAKQVGTDHHFLPNEVGSSISAIQSRIDHVANFLNGRTQQNAEKIESVLGYVRMCLIIVAAVMLLLASLGFLSSILGIKFFVYILVVLGWIVVGGTLLLCGMFLLLHNVVGDTCVAMEEWVQNPTSRTALDDFLPCLNNATAQHILTDSQDITFKLINSVNIFIANVPNSDANSTYSDSNVFYNQSGPSVPPLCNPFYSNMTRRSCSAFEVDLGTAAKVWEDYICNISKAGTCTTVGRLTPNIYSALSAAANVSYALYHYSPFLIDLGDCKFVRDTFSDIYMHHCPGLMQYSKWVYGGLAVASSALMLSVIFWLLYARARRHRLWHRVYAERAPPQFIALASPGPVKRGSWRS